MASFMNHSLFCVSTRCHRDYLLHSENSRIHTRIRSLTCDRWTFSAHWHTLPVKLFMEFIRARKGLVRREV
jgi:hypothetical protein